MLSLAPLVFGVAAAVVGDGTVRVSASGPGLAVVAHGAPLSVVLEEIGRHSGTRVTYEGAAPGALLTCDFRVGSPAEAFLRALEGSGLNYALHGGTPDAQGILIVSASFGTAAPRPAFVAPKLREVAAVGALPDEVAEVTESPDAEAVAIPPPDGAVPPRFGGPGRSEPVAAGVDDGDRPARVPPPTAAQGEARERMRERMGRPGGRRGPGSQQN